VRLTGREREVVQLVAAGRSNREIADALVITDRAVAREAHIGVVVRRNGHGRIIPEACTSRTS
jgi:FixJ family two-component response regulator